MTKKVAVITWDAQSVALYAQQVCTFFEPFIEVSTYNVQDGSTSRIQKADLYIISTCAYEGYKDVEEYLPLGGEVVITQVTIHKESLHKLLEVPRNTTAMLVNINPRMATETMAYLNKIGVNNIDFVPCYPGIAEQPSCKLAVTPGERRYVPDHVEEIIDIGPRVLSPETIAEIALKLRLEHLLETQEYRSYADSVVNNDYTFRRVFNRSIQLQSLFEILQDILDVGVIGIDDQGFVFTFNQKAEYVTGLKSQEVLDRKASEMLPYIQFKECCSSKTKSSPRLIKIGDVDVNMTITPVVRQGILIGAFALVQRFSDAEYKQHQLRLQLLNKGHRTKYTFADIVGESPAIQKACSVAKRMAASNGSILITGESGTGKELFAHAIHAASRRANYPFVAINCAAIPDSLLESELFGYEDGAFTGAKKGGKMGYFEFAHKGTLFLDEIEGMSQLLQLKLLRVIQEKEVLRVGGNRVIHVDVRIVAASNQNLFEMVKRGEFRKDLYYRVAVLPVELPPLRQRGNDVLLLFHTIQEQIGSNFVLSGQAQQLFLQHPWEGNIRELGNCVEYLACLGKQQIQLDDLPPGMLVSHQPKPQPTQLTQQQSQLLHQYLQIAGSNREEYGFVLNALYRANQTNQRLGRKSLSTAAMEAGIPLSEQEVRSVLTRLEELGLLKVSRGRSGSKITKDGEQVLLHLNGGMGGNLT